MYSLDISPFNKFFTAVPITALWIFFGIFTALFIIISLVLVYHWKEYSLYSPAISKLKAIYIIGGIVLLFGGLGALLVYSF